MTRKIALALGAAVTALAGSAASAAETVTYTHDKADNRTNVTTTGA